MRNLNTYCLKRGERKEEKLCLHLQVGFNFPACFQPLAIRSEEEARPACGMASDIHQMRIMEDGREFSANLTSTEYNAEICRASVTLASASCQKTRRTRDGNI